MTFVFRVLSLSVLLLISAGVFAQQVITIQSTITGSQEQPKVITIVPWQNAKPPEYFGEDVSGIDKQAGAFQPLDRKAFMGEFKYISSLKRAKP